MDKKVETSRPFKNAHFWLVIPFIITILGFYSSYWSRFFNTPLSWHLHGLSATLWYCILIIQPYLYNKGRLTRHRTLGMIGILLAGFVAASALAVIRGHIKDLNPELDIIYPYRYSLSLTDFIYIIGFLFSVVMSIIYRKDVIKHGTWLISSVFWVLSPATDRFTFFVIHPFLNNSSTWFDFESQFWISHISIITILLVLIGFDFRSKKAYWLPYAIVAIIHLITPLILVQLADSKWLADWFEFMYKPAFSD
ncbi:MAG: hypothetical protein HXY49_08810 [Ignavibacteriaceae bacterium]|nr:hypothetical protein [Ignavibacteriaceae bacterium]